MFHDLFVISADIFSNKFLVVGILCLSYFRFIKKVTSQIFSNSSSIHCNSFDNILQSKDVLLLVTGAVTRLSSLGIL